MERRLQGKLLRKAVCLAVVGASLTYGGTVFAASYDEGDINASTGKTTVVGVKEGTTYSKEGTVATVSGTDIALGNNALTGGGAIVAARVDKNTTTPPVVNINASNSVQVTSDYTAVSAQDGKVNIGSASAPVGTVTLSTAHTSPATGDDAAKVLSDNAYTTIFSRNLFGTGEVNIYGNNVNVETAEKTMTNMNFKYGTAISGNGNGVVNIHSTGTTTIHGAIESLNTSLQSNGTTGIKVNVNQDAADTGKVDMEGLFINAADKSEVNINGADGSSIKTNLVASASSATSGAGGKININLAGDNSTFAGGVLATNAGQLKLNAGNLSADYLKVFGENSKAELSGNNISFARAATSGGAALSALVNSAATNTPVATVMGKNISATSISTAVSAQDGIVNVGSADNAAENVTFTTTGTYDATGADAAAVLSDNAYASIFTRNLFGAGEVNVYGANINVETAEKTMTNMDFKYGTAISGNGSGVVNLHSTGTTTIHGAIESLNTSLQSNGTTGIKVNVNQDAADTGKVVMEGLFINAADKSEVNIKGAAASTVTTNLLASATDAAAGNGGKINLDLGANSAFTGNVTAKNGGNLTLAMGADSVFAGDITATGTGSIATVKGNDGKMNINAGNISANEGGTINLDNAILTFNDLNDHDKAGIINIGTGVTFKGETVELKQDLNLDNGSDITGAATVSNATVNVENGASATITELTVNEGQLKVEGNLNAPTLNITGDNSSVAVAGTLTTATANLGNADVSVDGALNATNLTKESGTLAVAGTLTATTANLGSAAVSVDGALKATDLNKESGALDVAGNVEVTNATLGSGTALTVGNDAKAGSFKAEKVELAAGSSIFLDPAFQDGATIAGASVAGVDTFTGGIAGDLAVGRNSILAAGSTDAQWAYNAFNNNASGWTWGEGQVAAALALKSAQTMAATGSITVDGSLTAAPTATANTATFAADSILIVDAAGVGTNAALTSTNGTLNVASGAKVLISGATDETNYQIVDGFAGDNANADNWTVGTDDRVLTAKINTDTAKQGDVFVKMNSNSVMNTTALSKIYQALYAAGLNDTASSNAAIAALSQAASKKFVASDAAAVSAVNDVAGITVTGGQQSSTLNGVKLFTGALQNHMTEKPSDRHIWAEYLHSNSKVRDASLAGSSFGFDNKFNGAVVGADFLATDSKHAGVAFAYGEGKVSGVSNNDYKTWGLDLYHAWHNEKADIMADLGYMKNDGEIKQANVIGNFNADPTSTAWTAGVRGDFKMANDSITPFAGLRYVRLTTDSHSVNAAAGTVLNIGKDTQNLWLLPVGVQFSKRIQKGNGVFVPKAEVGALFAFGDKDTNASLSVPGISATDTLGVAITDSASFLGSLGFTYETKKVNYGLAYQLQTGSKETRNGMWANVEFKF